MIIVNGWKPLTITTKCSILNVAAALYSPLSTLISQYFFYLSEIYKKVKNLQSLTISPKKTLSQMSGCPLKMSVLY